MLTQRNFSLFCLLPFISALLPLPEVYSEDMLTNPLCDLGCECPKEGQSFTLMDCSSRGITQLPDFLHFYPPLTNINLQSNFINHLEMITFAIGDFIEELDLSSNHIAHIDNFTFTPFKSLVLLRISHNRLEELSPGLLVGLSNLRVLEAGYNVIQRLTKDAFLEVPSLLELKLQYNPLFDLPVPNSPVVYALAQSISYRLQHSKVLGPLANFVVYQPYNEFFDITTELLASAGIYDPALAKVVADAVQAVGTVTSKLYFDTIGYEMATIFFNHGTATSDNIEPLAQSFANAVEVAACVSGLVDSKSVHEATKTGLFNTLSVYGWTSYDDLFYLYHIAAAIIKALAGVQ